ncbi:MAG: FCD domain-containing protein [Bacillota bacterium]
MLSEREKSELYILNAIARSTEPLGSGTLCSQLAHMGVGISEATVGRILRQLDQKNLTARIGYQGRRLTPEGEARLAQLARLNDEALITNELRESLRLQDKQDLIDTLVARRAIEREIARLAAVNISAEEIQHLRACVEDHVKHLARGESVSHDDMVFHRIIAKASHNRILEAALELIRQNWQYTPMLAYIRTQVNTNIVPDHQRILAALESGSPEGAENATIMHLDGLIRDVQTFWEIANPSDHSNRGPDQ